MDTLINVDTIAARIRFLRELTRLSRRDVCNKYKLPEISLRSWENGNLPVTDKAITRLLNIYSKEGVVVAFNWVKFGKGETPTINYDKYFNNVNKTNEDDLFDVLSFFRQKYDKTYFLQISDNSMSPIYNLGDLVIAVSTSDVPEKLNGKDCIILSDSYDLMLRKVFYEDKKIILKTLNQKYEEEIKNSKIKDIALVIWHYIKP